MNIKKNLTCCATSPICHLILLCTGFLVMVQLAHTHAHYTMSHDADSYVRNFCKKNLEECKRIVSNLEY